MLRLLSLSIVVLSAGPAHAQLGFFESSVDEQLRAEAVFLDTPTPDKVRRWLFQLTEEPHVAGTPQGKRVAEYVQAKFEEFGLETDVVQYDVFLNHPEHVAIRLVAPYEEEIPMMEEPVHGDKDSTAMGMFPGFHGYGGSGEAAGQIVYVNYGTPADYKKLESMGISVEGKIALARYGEVFRGLKVKEAQEHGAIAAIIYSDPADDGYMKGDIYPDGPMRPPTAIQRGSVQYLSIQPGDPSTPGYPSTEGALRVPRDEMETVPRIPSLPISYAGAEPILRNLGGPRVPDAWQGGLPFAYHVGPGGSAVEMEVVYDEGLKPIFNVFARIEGSTFPEQVVILGNHRDAWNHGAVDPNSGTATQLEVARGLAAALESGWRPKRTIVLASWDAEEYGLVGSVEWAEHYADELMANAVAYINVDSAATGDKFRAAGSPQLRDFILEIAHAVAEPQKGGTVGETWVKKAREDWAKDAPVDLDAPDEDFELHLGPLGSGSDYTAYLDHLGIASLDLRFTGTYGVYHSMYDNFKWMEEHGDPGFLYHTALAKVYGLVGMRLASADIVPLRFGSYARSLRRHLDALRRERIKKLRGADPDSEDDPPLSPDFAAVYGALGAFEEAGESADRRVDEVIASGDAELAAELSHKLMLIEREFLNDEGLPPERPWFRHMIYAPGTTTGYAAWPFPGPRQALEDNDAELLEHETQKVLDALNNAIAALNAVR